MSNEAAAFLKSILADPADPLPRLVFADWLEESGTRSNVAWSKFLRLSEEVARLPEDDPTHGKNSRLVARLGGMVQAKLRIKAEMFVGHAEHLRRLLPLRCLVLDLESVVIPREIVDEFPESLAREFGTLPLDFGPTTLHVAAESLSEEAADQIGFIVNRRVEWVAAAAGCIQEAIGRAYGETETESCDDLLTFTIPYTPTIRPDEAMTPAHRIIELFLTDAADEEVRDIVVRRAGPRVEVRFYRAGERDYDVWGGFPLSTHTPIVNHFRRLARLPNAGPNAEQSGIFRYHIGPHFHDVAMRIQPGISGPQVHLTILPYLAEPATASAYRVA